MNEMQHNDNVSQPPASVASTATTTMTFDTLGYDFAVVRVHGGTQATTDPALTVLKFLENDTNTNASNMTAVTALTGGTAGNTSGFFVIPAATVSGLGGIVAEFHLDLRKRKRFIQVNITPGTTLVYSVHVERGRAEQIPLTAAQKSGINMSSTAVVGCGTLIQI